MNNEFAKELNFRSDVFEGAERDFNFCLQRLLGRMIESETKEGTLTLQIGVKFKDEFIPNYDPSIDGETRQIHKPEFTHKVTTSIQIKDSKSGNYDSEMELVFDEETGTYRLVPVANTDQRSIFDTDYREAGKAEVDEEEAALIDGTERAALPGPTDEPEEYPYEEPTE